MPETVASMTAKLKQRFSDASTAMCEGWINDTNRELLGIIPEASRHRLDLSALVAGQATYFLNSDILEISNVLYLEDASTPHIVSRTTPDQITDDNPLFNFDPNGIPTRWYAETGTGSGTATNLRITLYPKPPATTSAGFPMVQVYATQCFPLSGSDELPEGLADYDVYLEGASLRAVKALKGVEGAGVYDAMYKEKIAFNRHRWSHRQPQQSDKAATPFNR